MKTLLISLAALLVVPAHANEYPPIGQLQTRDHIVVIHSGPDGLLYSVKTLAGVVVESQRTEQWIAAEFPELYATVVEGIAKKKTQEAQARDDGASAVRAADIQADLFE